MPLRKRPVALTITGVSVLLLVLLTIFGGLSKKLETAQDTVATTPLQQNDAHEQKTEMDAPVFDFGLEDAQ